MVTRFKCCKNKEVLYYLCITCDAIFHHSCANRLKSVVKLSGNKIYCCAACESADNDDKNYDLYQKEINKLKDELEDKEKHIIRLMKKAKDFEEDVLETEQSFIEEQNHHRDKLKTQKEKICTLQREIIDAEEMNKNLVNLINDYKQSIEEMQNEMTELRNIHADMLKTISLLEETNDRYSMKIDQLEKETVKDDECRTIRNVLGNANFVLEKTLEGRNEQQNSIEEYISLYEELSQQTGKNRNSGKKVLILGDEFGRNCARNVYNSMYSLGFIVEGFIKPNTEIADITSNLFSQTIHFGQDDYVFIVFKSKNISNHNTLNIFLKNVLPLGKFTNLVILLKSEPADKTLTVLLENKVNCYKHNNINCSVQCLEIRLAFRKSLGTVIRSYVQKNRSTLRSNVLLSPSIILTNEEEHCTGLRTSNHSDDFLSMILNPTSIL